MTKDDICCEMLLDQEDVMNRIKSFVSNFNKTPKERITSGYLAARASGLKELWGEFTANHKSIVSQSSTKIRTSHEYFTSEIFSKYEDVYYETSGRIAEKQIQLVPIIPAAAVSVESSSTNPPIQQVVAQHIRIPQLNVPNFNGNYEDWQSFRDIFVAAVHSNQSLQPAQKLQYLKSLLQGTAETLLKHTSITNDNYAVAWQTLNNRFNNKRAIVTTHLRKLFSQRLVEETPQGIRQLLDTTKDCINALKIQQIDVTTWDSILVYIVSQYIPKNSLELWEQSLTGNDIPHFDDLLEFLENRFRILEFSPILPVLANNRSRSKPQTFHAVATVCRVCQGPQHSLRLCPKFLEMNPSQRLSHAKKNKLCKNCFAFSHQTSDCLSKGRCNVCNQQHHSLLHLNASSQASNIVGSSISTSIASTPDAHTSSNHSMTLMSRPTIPNSDDSILATALVSVTAFDGTKHVFRALLDNASQENFVSKKVVQFLGIKPQPSSTIVSGVGKSQAPRPIGQISFNIGSTCDPTFSMLIDAIVLPIITYNLPSKSLHVNQSLIADLTLADPSYGTPGSIDILLSATSFAELTMPAIRKEAATIALQTKLGWVLYGDAISSTHQTHRRCFHITSDDNVSSALQAFWKLEEPPTSTIYSQEDVKCEDIYAKTHSRKEDGRYCVNLPFKVDEIPIIGSSRDRAVSRLLQIERKLAKSDKLREDYNKCINEYRLLGHMHLTSKPEEDHKVQLVNGKTTYTSYYLPHHAVIKSDSTTTKLRVVFDASSKTTNGQSLNDMLLIGPVLQDNLFNLILRWRTHQFVIKADIEKMYRQVLINNAHQPYQRIVWRDKPQDPIQDFELRTVTFGTASAPYLAIKTIKQLAEDERFRYPIGASAIQNDFYVDDLLAGADTVDDAIEKQRQVVKILQCGGFNIRKWSSNSSLVTDQIEETAKEICSENTLKALGILWFPHQDRLSIKVTFNSADVSSKRQLLSEVAKLFDPLGWIAPAIISMKILLQKLWLAGLCWDESLPTNIKSEWNEFKSQLPSIEQIRICRWFQTTQLRSFDIHGFSDASEKAYAAAIYIRVQISKSEWSTHLIAAKTRVAPVKQISLPRLELCAAVLLAKLLSTIKSTLKATTIHAWTDSEIVLAWLQGHPNRWTTFVGNRVSEIHSTIDAAVWHHVPTKDNPADCASRGISPQELVQHPLWWHGPKWLATDDTTWPKKLKKEIPPVNIESKKVRVFISIPYNDTLFKIIMDCSTFSKAIRVTAYVRRVFINKTYTHVSHLLSVEETNHAKMLLIQHDQKTSFPEEYAALTNSEPISKSSKLLSLNPFLDMHKLIRVGGRLKNSEIPFAARHPIILPKKSRLTEMIIDEAHDQTLHGGVSLMLAHLRNEFWIIDARNTIRFRIHKCNDCFKFSNPGLTQLMGNLPKPRVTANHPFGHTGLDYAGPITLRLRRHAGRPIMSKGYICLFVCLATKAVHLELVGDMTAATFLAAFTRFTSRRGLPSDMYCDNGTYFVRAAHDIDKDMQQVKSYFEEAAKLVTQTTIKWHFIPPSAPHFGGLWEAGIKSTKHHLKRTLGNEVLTYEELTTTLSQIESCLNSRPLCPITSDPNDFEILTPGHFLIGRPLLSRPQPSVLEIPTNRLDQWQRIYQKTLSFWRQWQSEYLTRLQQRPKWLSESAPIQKGELVLLKEDNLPPLQWKMARIIDTHPGTDGITRVVTLKTPTTTLKRPIVKICRLPSQ